MHLIKEEEAEQKLKGGTRSVGRSHLSLAIGHLLFPIYIFFSQANGKEKKLNREHPFFYIYLGRSPYRVGMRWYCIYRVGNERKKSEVWEE